MQIILASQNKNKLKEDDEKNPLSPYALSKMISFEIINNDHPCSKLTSKFQQLCFKNGLLLLKSGPNGNVIRIICPINIKSYQVYEIIDIINKSLNELNN